MPIRKTFLVVLLFVGCMGISSVAQAAADIPVTSMSHVKVVTVPNVSATPNGGSSVNCSNLGALCELGTVAYCVKVDSTDSVAVLYKVKNIEGTIGAQSITSTPIKTASGSVVSLGHANGMASYQGSLYIASGKALVGENSQIFKVSTVGVIEGKYKVRDSNGQERRVLAISSFRNDQFLLRLDPVGGVSSTYREYAAASIGSDGYFEIQKYFTVPVVDAYELTQDIYYSGGRMYLVSNAKSEQGYTVYNRIQVINLSAVLIDGGVYYPEEYLQDNSIGETTEKYELESMFIGSTGKIYACANAVFSSVGSDGVYCLERR